MREYLIFLTCLFTTLAFNVDDESVTEFKGPIDGSLYGYSVGLRSTNSKDKVMIGAPMRVIKNMKVGAVYSCTMDPKKDCDELNRHEGGEVRESTYGMSISTINDTVLATAPRFARYNAKDETFNQGRFVAYHDVKTDFKYWYRAVPCRSENFGNLEYGYCLAGMSSSVMTLDNIPFFVVGAPGSLNLMGALFSVFQRPTGSDFSAFKTAEDRLSDNFLMGYSVTTGKFTDAYKDNYVSHIAGGAPRGEDMEGKVVIYTQFKEKISTDIPITSPNGQVGSYFGAAVCAVDVDNNGRDDLLVGSPRYSISEDEGIAYVFKSRPGKDVGFDQGEALVGDNTIGGQFGHTISNIGDINQDGYSDVAIGAPYGGPGKKGAVYIFNGGKAGLVKKYSQVIYSKNLPNQGGAGFGISISGNVDLDGNKYPDMIVGAHTDGKAFVFKSKPVVKLTSVLSSSTNAVPTRQHDQFKCTGSLVNHNCLNLTVDLTYNGEGNPDELMFEVKIELDKKKPPVDKRAMTLNKTIFNVTLKKGVTKPITIPIAVVLSIDTDVINAIEFVSSYTPFVGASCIKPCPVFDTFSKNSDSHEITYLKECKSKVTCEPNLILSADLDFPKNPDEKTIIYGRVYEVDVLAKVENIGEAAYQAVMTMNYTSDLDFSSIQVNKVKILFDEPIDLSSTTKQLWFRLANPIAANSSVNVVVKFSVSKSRPSSAEYTFAMEASAFGKDTDTTDNKATVNIPTKIEYCVAVQSEAKPPVVQYQPNTKVPQVPTKDLNVTYDVIGSEVNYTFYVQNSGRLPVEKLEASMQIVDTKDNKNFIYVIAITVDGTPCRDNDLNPMNYTSPYRKSEAGDASPDQKRFRRNILTESTDAERRSRRTRRDIETITCRIGTCRKYKCQIDKIDPQKGVLIKVQTRFWNHNLDEIAAKSVLTEVLVELKGAQRDWYIQKNGCAMNSNITVEISKSVQEGDETAIAWWIVLLAVLGALLLLATAIAVMYKMGFFKRKRTAKNITGPTDNPNEASNVDYGDDDDDDDE